MTTLNLVRPTVPGVARGFIKGFSRSKFFRVQGLQSRDFLGFRFRVLVQGPGPVLKSSPPIWLFYIRNSHDIILKVTGVIHCKYIKFATRLENGHKFLEISLNFMDVTDFI